MNTALVVVDAWNTSKSSFHKEKPMWDKDVKDNVKSFSNFINYVCRVERKKNTTIVHSFGMDVQTADIYDRNLSAITIEKKDEVTNSLELGKVIENMDEIFFCGFHFGKCVQMHMKMSNKYLSQSNNILHTKNKNIALNLCMILPFNQKPGFNPRNSWKFEIREEYYNYFMWSPWKFEQILGRG